MPKILVVEDNETNRDLLRRRLERRGHQVIIANDGEQGYSLAHSEVPDLVLMDISLPGMNGWQVAQLLKANDSTRHIPIIVLTAHALISDREKAFEMGCNDYETKPIEFARLSQKIDNLLLEKKTSITFYQGGPCKTTNHTRPESPGPNSIWRSRFSLTPTAISS